MSQFLSYSPGQIVTLFLDTKDSDGYYCDGYYEGNYKIDGYESPIIFRVISPSFVLLSDFPKPLIRFDTGIYYVQFTLPTGASAVGTYWVDIKYRQPIMNLLKLRAYQVVVTAPFGLYSITSF